MIAYFIILMGAILRVLPHPANFAPIAALALFGSVYLPKKQALVLPIIAMIMSDFAIGFDSLESRLSVYGSFLIIGLIGLWVRNHKNVGTVVGASFIGSLLFYLVTNLVILYPPIIYPHTLVGQIASYTNALPFFRNTLLGDMFYTAVFFGAYELVKYYYGYQSKSPNPRQV